LTKNFVFYLKFPTFSEYFFQLFIQLKKFKTMSLISPVVVIVALALIVIVGIIIYKAVSKKE